MARLQLNKSSLARESKNLRAYERFLPSLDLKRQQLTAERSKASRALAQTRQEIEELHRDFGRSLPMLANLDVDLTNLVQLKAVEIDRENLVGTRLPRLKSLEVDVSPYAFLAKPHWVDAVVARLRHMLELQARLQIEEQRLRFLEAAVKTITQRVNLFDKVLIPRTRANIKKIKVYLSDADMAAVVRSKLAKKKRAEALAS